MSKVKQPEIAAVVLVKNDEYWLPYVLEASRNFFPRYVIYDVGSTDRTPDIIDWFVDSQKKNSDFYVRKLPHCEPLIQGAFRNSMIAEARTDWYFILDADEVYTPEGYRCIRNRMGDLMVAYEEKGVIYGLVPRVEVRGNLSSAYGLNRGIPHHRIYHGTAIWEGTHPGEDPVYYQKEQRELWFPDVATCWHFHNADRSTKDEEVPSRIRRRSKNTYRPGDHQPISLLDELPILRERIQDFPVSSVLGLLQRMRSDTL
jgi:hypothetical protein